MHALGRLRDALKGEPLAAIGLVAITVVVVAGGVLALLTLGMPGSPSARSTPTNTTGVTFQVTSTPGGTTGTPSASPGATPAAPGASATPGSGSSGTPTPGGTGQGTATPGSPGATATPTLPGSSPMATATATATATASPPPTQVPPAYAFTVVGPFTPAVSTQYDWYYVDVENTGTATWGSAGTPSLYCLSQCTGASGAAAQHAHVASSAPRVQATSVPPGEVLRYPFSEVEPLASRLTTSLTWKTVWELDNPVTFTFLQPTIVITITRTFANVVDNQQAPSCGNPAGIAWTYLNTSGGSSVACSGSSLIVQQDGAAPYVELTGIPSGYNAGNFITHVHIHFDDSSPNAYAGYAFFVPSDSGQCDYERFEFRADGTWRYLYQYGTGCQQLTIVETGSVSPTNSYDLGVYMYNHGGYFYVNGSEVFSGGVNMPGPYTALTVNGATGSSGDVEFSNFVYGMIVNPPDQFTAANG